MTEQEFQALLQRNPDLHAPGMIVMQREEPLRAKAYRTANPFVPTEAHEQRAIMQWAGWHEAQWPELKFLFHVPNEANRGDIGQVIAVAEGLRPGVPDLLLPVAKGEYIGLAIELKRVDRSNHPTDDQWRWIRGMRSNRWRVDVCYGFDEAIAVLEDYLKGSTNDA